MQINGFELVCPRCRSILVQENPNTCRCAGNGESFQCIDGIWRFISSDRLEVFSKFMDDYQKIRLAEDRGGKNPSFYRALPFLDRDENKSKDWKIRATSFEVFIEKVLQPFERGMGKQLKCVDLGAGNAWLSHRLAQRGHLAAAVDLISNDWDGLGSYKFYEIPILPIQAEFDRLPFGDHQCDLVIFNSSLHYSPDYEETLGEALRILKSTGRLVILDSPVYQSAESGKQMLAERKEQFIKLYGFPSDAIKSEGFLTYSRIADLSNQLGIEWKFIKPAYGIEWSLRFWKARILGKREPADFIILVGEARNHLRASRN